jgi:hypothetical protein
MSHVYQQKIDFVKMNCVPQLNSVTPKIVNNFNLNIGVKFIKYLYVNSLYVNKCHIRKQIF